MAPETTGGILQRGRSRFARLRARKRMTLKLVGCRTDLEAVARVGEIQPLINRLMEKGKHETAEKFARKMAKEKDPDERAGLLKVAELALRGGFVEQSKLRAGMPFKAFAALWTNGGLHEQFPDHVPRKREKSVRRDTGILDTYVNPVIGELPLAALELGHIEDVMRKVPRARSSATRRHVAQVMHRVLRFAVYPAKLLPASPIPKGFLPRITRARATSHLYPADEAKLLARTEVPLARRVLYGLLHREGFRIEEALQLEWTDLELEHGTVRLDRNKTNDPRAWALGGDVAEALRRYRELRGRRGRLVFPAGTLPHRTADAYRHDVEAAGVARAELFVSTDERRRLRIHDTRTGFVTLALATGKGEVWVMDRTGHKSSVMVQRYRRAARTAAELGVGWWQPLQEAIPELQGSGSDRDPDVGDGGGLKGNKLVNPTKRDIALHGGRIQNPPSSGRVGSSPTFGTDTGNRSSDPPHVRGCGSQSDPNRCPMCAPKRRFVLRGHRFVQLRPARGALS